MGKCVFSEFGLSPPSTCRICTALLILKVFFPLLIPNWLYSLGFLGLDLGLLLTYHTPLRTNTHRGFLSEKVNYKKNINHYK